LCPTRAMPARTEEANFSAPPLPDPSHLRLGDPAGGTLAPSTAPSPCRRAQRRASERAEPPGAARCVAGPTGRRPAGPAAPEARTASTRPCPKRARWHAGGLDGADEDLAGGRADRRRWSPARGAPRASSRRPWPPRRAPPAPRRPSGGPRRGGRPPARAPTGTRRTARPKRAPPPSRGACAARRPPAAAPSSSTAPRPPPAWPARGAGQRAYR
jgi:hypothetical protein